MSCCRRGLAASPSPLFAQAQKAFAQNPAPTSNTSSLSAKQPCYYVDTQGDFLAFEVSGASIMVISNGGNLGEARSVLGGCNSKQGQVALQVINNAYSRFSEVQALAQGKRVTLAFLKTKFR